MKQKEIEYKEADVCTYFGLCKQRQPICFNDYKKCLTFQKLNFENSNEFNCIYIKDCNVKKMPICYGIFENCIVYKRRKILEKNNNL